MKELNVRLTLEEEVLGSWPSDPTIYDSYVNSKNPDKDKADEESQNFKANISEDSKITIFPRDEDGNPILYDYQIKGFFKDACSMLNRVSTKDPETGKKKPANESSKLTAYKKIIDGLIFPTPRKIHFRNFDKLGNCQRPLRISDANGERVALASSETIPAGATLEFGIVIFNDDHEAAVREWLNYGVFRGLLQWRNSGKGRFSWKEIDKSEMNS